MKARGRPRLRARGVALLLVITSFGVGACGDNGDDRSAFCRRATDTDSFATTFAGFDPDDVEAARETLTEARDVEIRLRRDAPEAIRADLDLLVQFFDDLVEGLENVDPDAEERPVIYDEVATRIDEIESASERIETYVEANCPPENP